MSAPGRPKLIESDTVIKKLLEYKAEIIFSGDKVLSKNNCLWQRISEELGGNKSAKSLHVYVCNNKNGVRDLLNGREKQETLSCPRGQSDSSSTSSLEPETKADAGIIGTPSVTISMKMSSFKSLAKEMYYKKRKVMKLEPGVWQSEISERLWNATKLKCGFNFKNHYLTMDLSTGSAKGTLMFIEVEDADLNKEVQLQSIPKTFSAFLCGRKTNYKLIGIVNFRPPAVTRKTEGNLIGHYTGFCPRPGNKWTEFDDITVTCSIEANHLYAVQVY